MAVACALSSNAFMGSSDCGRSRLGAKTKAKFFVVILFAEENSEVTPRNWSKEREGVSIQ